MPRWTGFAAASRGMERTAILSDLFDFWPAEDTGWQEDQHDRQDREGSHVLVIDREIGRPHALDEADQEAAKPRARDGADAAEHGRRERLHARHEPVGE